MNFRQIVFLIIFLSLNCSVFAQASAIYFDLDAEYRKGVELFDREKYSPAKEHFTKVIANHKYTANTTLAEVNQDLISSNAQYYEAICALELYHNNAEYLLLKFVDDFPENPKSRVAFFQLGKFYFRNKDNKKAMEWFTRCDQSALKDAEKSELSFKRGYCYLESKDLKNALIDFDNSKKYISKFTYPASYYSAFISYENKDYEKALEGFEYLQESKNYGNIAPYYITSIYYEQNKFAELIKYATPLSEKEGLENLDDINRLLGQAHYQSENYRAALTYFNILINGENKLTPRDIYQLGYCYYKLSKFKDAKSEFEKLVTDNDVFAQNAQFLLGDCFLQLDVKQNARSSFLNASKMDFDAKIKEEASFNYAKLSYELKYHQEALTALQSFIKIYPKSEFLNDSKELLGTVLLTTKDYKQAVEILESVNRNTQATKEAYQKVCYLHGVEVFNLSQYKESIVFFDKSLLERIDPLFSGLAHYWKAEAQFRLGLYKPAIKNYDQFLNSGVSKSRNEYVLASYGKGYSYFKQDVFGDAAANFENVVSDRKVSDAIKYDSYTRAADAYFMVKNYPKSTSYYRIIANLDIQNSDYAYFQLGMISGLQNKPEQKISNMNLVLTQFKNSTYADDAIYETASTYLITSQYDQSLTEFDKLIQKYPTSSYISKALLSKGLIYFNQSNDALAIETYKIVIEKYPDSDAFKEALLAMRNLYVDAGNGQEYVTYANSLPNANLSANTQDSIVYQASYSSYTNGNCVKAINGFEGYLSRFENGFFALDALYYRGSCYYNQSQTNEALEDFNAILAKSRNRFTERALLKSANIYYGNKNYPKAIENFVELEKIAEYQSSLEEVSEKLMRSYYALNQLTNANNRAENVINSLKASEKDQLMAHLIQGKYYLNDSNSTKAQSSLEIVKTKASGDVKAESQLLLAQIFYSKGKYLKAQDEIFEMINALPGDIWVLKGYLLLADTYIKLEDEFMARNTLQSILDNYNGNDQSVIDTTKRKLELLGATYKKATSDSTAKDTLKLVK
ncbi:MAG: TolA-binding protein [Sphingobacteriales bacterium]|jgi:TolA-binding protein